MTGHLGAERISALLDEPWADKPGQAHLETCADCQEEFERVSRMRMALSALPEHEPPAGQWAAIEAALDELDASSVVSISAGSRIARRFMVPGPLQAAAALVLFAGGVFAGLQLTSGPADPVVADVPAVVSTGDDRALLDGLNQMESLRAPLRQVGINPNAADPRSGSTIDRVQAAQVLARLEGLIRATREHLEANPGDAGASAYLLELVGTRNRLAEELDRANGTWTW